MHSSLFIKPWFSLLSTCLLLAIVYPLSGLDFAITDLYFNGSVFYLKHDTFLVNVMHDGLKTLIFIVSATLIGLWLASFKFSRFKTIRRQLLWAFAGMLLSTTLVLVIKNLSVHSCPDKLLMYHGTKPYFDLLNTFTQSSLAGHCWPGGHASAGICLLAIYYAFRKTHPITGHIVLALSLLLWFLMGWAQIMRGLHFLSHNLWTAWLVWLALECQQAIWSPYPEKTL
jgi:membrane-associated PAP2 superfamily phosphatase